MKQMFPISLSVFNKNESGATAIIYALCILPLMLVLGLAIDFSRIQSAQTHLQTAVDQATLASALDFSQNAGLSEGQRLRIARDTFEAVYAADVLTAHSDFETVSVNIARIGDTGIEGTATVDYPLAFGGLFGRPQITLTGQSAAAASPPQRLEIVLALDNTTSMFNNDRFNLMRSASKGFVNQLYDQTSTPGLTAIGVVPWATLVNINSERPGAFDASNAPDRNPGADGSRAVPKGAFEDRAQYLLAPELEENFSRAELEAAFAPVAWRGCIRSAPDERISRGGRVSSPLTDAPVRGMRWHTALVEPELQSAPLPGNIDAGDTIVNASFELPQNNIAVCAQDPDLVNGRRVNLSNVHMDVDRACLNNNNQLDFVEACVSDSNEHDYFRQGGEACPWTPRNDIFPWTRRRPISGPNQNCPVAMLGLSEDRGQIIDKLDEMYPVTGGTHVDIGLMWGLRILSPETEWASFFGQDRPAGYEEEGARKIMILLTDGQNTTPSQIEGYYGCTENEPGQAEARANAGDCWEAPGVSPLNNGALDALTTDSCNAITETYGIELFTIAVDINDNRALDLLADCAGDPARAFNIRASELETVFEAIAAQELRLLD